MKKSGKIIAVLMAAVIAAALAACSGTTESTEDENVVVHRIEDVVLDEEGGNSVADGEVSESVTIKADADGTFRSAMIALSGDDLEEEAAAEGLPFGVKISYFLDGVEISAEDLAGQSGSLKIRIDYQNDSKTTVKVDGEDVETVIPFTFVSILLLPKERFSNIEVTNGGVTGMADSQIVYGYGMPGLKETLGLDLLKDELKAIEEKLDDEDEASVDEEEDEPFIEDFVEITADVENCKIEMNVTMVMNGLMKDMEDEDLDELDDLPDKLWDFGAIGGELAEGVGELKDGAGEFGDGLGSYVDGVGALADGATQLSEGASALASQGQAIKDGASQLSDGLAALQAQLEQLAGAVPGGEALAAAAAQLSQGAARLSSGVNAYADGASSVASGAAALSSGASELKGYGSDVKDGYAKLLDGMGELQDGVEELKDKLFWNISSLSEGQLRQTIKVMHAMKQADREFKSWGLADETDAENVRFIIECDKID